MSAPDALLLGDQLGPRGRRRVAVATVLGGAVVVGLLAVAVLRVESRGQLEWERWEPFTQWSVARFLLLGLVNTLKAAGLAMVLALLLGTGLALLRLARTAPLRWFSAAFVEFFRGVPLILLILYMFIGLRRQGIDISPFRALVVALALYNGAVLGEVFRAGIRSLDRGQTEAAYAIGLGYWPAQLLVVIPQAARRMVPAIVSQMVTLLKDTSLGYVITYDELLRRSKSTGQFFNNPLQAFLIVALMYIVVNLALSRLAAWLERRQRRRLGAGAMVVTGAAEDLQAVGVAGVGEVGYGGGAGGGGA